MLPPSRSADAQITSRLRSPSLGASPARDKKIDSGLGLVRRLRRRAGLSVACRAGAWGGEADTPAEDTVAGRYRERHRDGSRHLRRRGTRRARQRRHGGVQGVCGAAALMCAHGAAHDAPSAERAQTAEGLWQRVHTEAKTAAQSRFDRWGAHTHTALTCVCAPAVEVELRRLRVSGMYPHSSDKFVSIVLLPKCTPVTCT